MSKSYLLIIPARGGSKGIPRKNITPVNGRPLISYTINAALKAIEKGIKGEVAVSTDDEEIAGIAREWGAKVPFIRPEEISGDESKSIDFLLHAVNFYWDMGIFFEATVLLEPTAPLRSAQDVISAIETYEKSGQDSLISVYQEDHLSDRSFYKKQGVIGKPLNPAHNSGARRQDSESLYIRNGVIYITKISFLQEAQKIFSDTPALYVMPKQRSTDINTIDDIEYAEYLINKIGWLS